MSKYCKIHKIQRCSHDGMILSETQTDRQRQTIPFKARILHRIRQEAGNPKPRVFLTRNKSQISLTTKQNHNGIPRRSRLFADSPANGDRSRFTAVLTSSGAETSPALSTDGRMAGRHEATGRTCEVLRAQMVKLVLSASVYD